MITTDYVEEDGAVPNSNATPDTPAAEKPKQHVKFTKPVLIEGALEGVETIALPSDFDENASTQLNRAPNLNYSLDPKSRDWASTVVAGMKATPGDNAFEHTLNKPGRSYSQFIERDGVRLEPTYQKFKANNGAVADGDSAVLRLATHRQLGTICKIPLYNSGIWITLRSPSEPAILDLHRIITQDKTDLGRRSYGLSFSGTTAVFSDNIVSFALEHLYGTNVILEQGVTLRDLITSHDIPAICLGLAAVIWPSGFNFSRACIADPATCRHVVTGKVSIMDMLVVDDTVLNDWQITHMSKKANSTISISDVKRYQDELAARQNRQVIIDENKLSAVAVTFKVPNINGFFQDSYRWINELTQMAEKALTKDATNASRSQYVTNQGYATALRQYSHWVKSISFDSVIEDPETLDDSLTLLSSDDSFRVEFMKEAEKFIGQSTITCIGIPVFECPSCKRINKIDERDNRFGEAIPIDVYQVFFPLIEQKVEKIKRR